MGSGAKKKGARSPPLLFIAIFTSHRSPLSERLEQAIQMLIQNSRLHPDFFAKNMSLSNRWSTETFKKRRKKAFSMTCRRDWIRFDKHEKHFSCEALVVAFKKRKTSTIFTSIFQHFPCLENCWANFKTFQQFKTLYEPWVSIVWTYFDISLAKHLFILEPQQIPFICNLCLPSLPEFQKHGRCGKDHRSNLWKI